MRALLLKEHLTVGRVGEIIVYLDHDIIFLLRWTALSHIRSIVKGRTSLIIVNSYWVNSWETFETTWGVAVMIGDLWLVWRDNAPACSSELIIHWSLICPEKDNLWIPWVSWGLFLKELCHILETQGLIHSQRVTAVSLLHLEVDQSLRYNGFVSLGRRRVVAWVSPLADDAALMRGISTVKVFPCQCRCEAYLMFILIFNWLSRWYLSLAIYLMKTHSSFLKLRLQR